jgi:peptidyl-prolyl cis-trans isomerase B (cyclophilin B)
MHIILFDETPLHKANFLKLAKEGFYNGTTFHRIISNFMIQGGDINSKDSIKTNDGQGDLGYRIKAEFNPSLQHLKGAFAAARLGDNVNPERESSACQFYIVQNQNGTPHLDGQYTVYGQVIHGIEVVDLIAAQPKERNDRPLTDIKMKVTVKKLKKKKITKLYGYTFK